MEGAGEVGEDAVWWECTWKELIPGAYLFPPPLRDRAARLGLIKLDWIFLTFSTNLDGLFENVTMILFQER